MTVTNLIHGEYGTRLYHTWEGMKQRCHNPKAPNYHKYGAAGIRVCEAWQTFSSFSKWAHAYGYQDDLYIDRIDNSKGYSPENCRWVTMTENNRNRRGVRLNNESIARARELIKAGESLTNAARTLRVDRECLSLALRS